MLKKYSFICISLMILFSAVYFCSCGDNDASMIKNAEKHKDMESEIYIGFTGPWKNFEKEYDLWPGINLAIEEVNAKGGVLGKKLVPLKYDNGDQVYEAKVQSLKMSKSYKVSCIVTCNSSDVAIPSAVIAEHYKMLMIAPFASAIYSMPVYNRLELVYQNCPTIQAEAEKLLSCAKQLSCKRLIIYNALEQHYAALLGDSIENVAYNQNLKIAKRAVFSIHSGSETYEKDLREMKELYTFDGIIIIGPPKSLIKIAQKIKKLKMDIPVFSGMTANCKSIAAPENTAFTEGMIFTAFFDTQDMSPESKSFYRAFMKKYNQPPLYFAALSYGTVKALVHAIEEAKSAKPRKIADTLNKLKTIKGLPGPLSFASNPEKLNNNFVLNTVKDGKIVKFSPPKKEKTPSAEK